MSRQHVMHIVGAGIVGLTAAALFGRAGWSVTVHERDPEIREVGAAIGIKPGAAKVLGLLGILDEVSGNVVLTTEERRNRHGRVLQSRRLGEGQRFYNPLRQKLVDTLQAVALKHGAEIVTNAQVRAVDSDGHLLLESGKGLEGDLVIVANGFRSGLRSSLGLERKAVELAAGTTRVLIPRSGEEPTRMEYWSGPLRIGVAPTSETVTYVYLSAPESDRHAARLPIEPDYWAEKFPGLPVDFFQRVHASGGVRHLYPLVYCREWVKGRVCLLGDAAHALPATLGIGASMGIVNAYHLLRWAGDGVTSHGLYAWDRARRPPTVATQRSAVAYSAMTVLCPRPLLPARNGMLRLLDNTALNSRVLGLKAIDVDISDELPA